MTILTKSLQYFESHKTLQQAIYLGLAVLTLLPFISTPTALILGIIVAQLIGNPFSDKTAKLTQLLFKISVIGLGFGMNANAALQAGKDGLIFTVISIICILILGYLLARVLKIDKITGYLISAGTAICGGSAIAAISPIVKAKPNQISIALATVFTLNSLALILFPIIGHWLELSQYQFGLWSAIAIHDTSSVVGAASKYGNEALEVATTVKLARALWIIPLSFLSVWIFKTGKQTIKFPYFIIGFVIAMLINTYIPATHIINTHLVAISKSGLTLTLFLIGSGLSYKILKSVGIKPLLMAIIVWVMISVLSLLMITKEL